MAQNAVLGISPGAVKTVLHFFRQVSSLYVTLWFMGGPPTDLKNMVDRQEWKGQRFNKKTCKKAFIIKNCFKQCDAKYF